MALDESPQEPLVELDPRRPKKGVPEAGRRETEQSEPLSGLALLTEAAQTAIQTELDAADRQAAAVLEEGHAEADTVRQQCEAQAREIIARAEREAQTVLQRGRAEAEAAELAARVRAREIRAQAEAKLWGRLETIRPGIRESAQGQRRPDTRQGAASGRYQPDQGRYQSGSSDFGGTSRYSTGQPYSARTDFSQEPAVRREPAPSQESEPDRASTGDWGRPAEPAYAGREQAGFRIVPQERIGDSLRYRIEGPFSMAEVLNLRQTVSDLPGVTAVDVTPQGNEAVNVSLVSRDPESTLDGLRRLPGFSLEETEETQGADRTEDPPSSPTPPSSGERVGAFQAALDALKGNYNRQAKTA